VKAMPVVPFRVFGIAARPQSLPPEVVLLWNWPLVQSMTPVKVSPLLLLRSRFAVSTCTGCAVFRFTGCRRLRFRLSDASSRRASPSSRVSPSSTYPTASTAESSHGLCVPSALEEFEVHSPRAKPARYVPPSGYGYPLDGFRPQIPCRFCFAPAALVGFTPSEVSSPDGRPTVFRPGRTCVPLAQRYLRHSRVGPARRASVSRFTPAGIALLPLGVLGRRPPAPPLGFAPLGCTCEGLVLGFPRTPPACLVAFGGHPPHPPAPRSISQPSPRLACLHRSANGRDNPCGVLAPARSRPFRFTSVRVMEFTSRQVLHCCRPSGGLWTLRNPAEAALDRPWVPHK
jgi:hypothetical protein